MRVSIDWVIESYLTLVPQTLDPASVGSSLGMESHSAFRDNSVRVQPRKLWLESLCSSVVNIREKSVATLRPFRPKTHSKYALYLNRKVSRTSFL